MGGLISRKAIRHSLLAIRQSLFTIRCRLRLSRNLALPNFLAQASAFPYGFWFNETNHATGFSKISARQEPCPPSCRRINSALKNFVINHWLKPAAWMGGLITQKTIHATGF